MATVYIADKVQQGFFEFTPTTQLAQDLNIARPTAVKTLQSLNQAGIIETREGAKGGVRLAKPADQVTVLDILAAIEGGTAVVPKPPQLQHIRQQTDADPRKRHQVTHRRRNCYEK